MRTNTFSLWISTKVVAALFSCTWLLPCETAAILVQVLCTLYKLTPVYSVTIWSQIGRVHVCSAVTCTFGGIIGIFYMLLSTGVCNGYWSKNQHRKLNLEKKTGLPLLQGLKTKTFWSQVHHSNRHSPSYPHSPFIIIHYSHWCCITVDNSYLSTPIIPIPIFVS